MSSRPSPPMQPISLRLPSPPLPLPRSPPLSLSFTHTFRPIPPMFFLSLCLFQAHALPAHPMTFHCPIFSLPLASMDVTPFPVWHTHPPTHLASWYAAFVDRAHSATGPGH